MRVILYLLAAVGALVVISMVVCVVAVGDKDTRRSLQREGAHEVAGDLIEQYDFLVKNGGSRMDICAQAGAVALMYQQAQDVDRFRAWKAAQRRDCARAGIDTGEDMTQVAPSAPVQAAPGLGQRCYADGEAGTCMVVDACLSQKQMTKAVSGSCAGPANVQCCVPLRQ